ncbi:MAG: BACON domain-containing protein [Alistipes sp.]|nr:BACON domain-containing protein [Alistipes sp.]
MKKLFLLIVLGVAILSTSCEKEPFLDYELPNLGDTLEFTAEGGSIDVDITAECNYEILCKENWISHTKTDTGIKITAQANLDTKARESEIRILYYHRKEQIYKSINIKQSAFEPQLEIDKTELNFDVNGGSKTISVTANAKFSVSKSQSWISCVKSSNSVKITAKASSVTHERSDEVKIYLTDYNVTKIVKITQKEFAPKFWVKDSELDFGVGGGTTTISVLANFDYSVSENASWLSWEISGGGVKLTATANVEEYERTADVKIYNNTYGKSAVVKVRQEPSILHLSTTSEMFSSSGGSFTVEIQHNVDYDVTINEYNWITQESRITTNDGDKLRFSVAEQKDFASRTATIFIKGSNGVVKTITIEQTSPNIVILSPSDSWTNFKHKGGVFTVELKSVADYECNISVDWIRVKNIDIASKITIEFTIDECTPINDLWRTANIKFTCAGETKTVYICQYYEPKIGDIIYDGIVFRIYDPDGWNTEKYYVYIMSTDETHGSWYDAEDWCTKRGWSLPSVYLLQSFIYYEKTTLNKVLSAKGYEILKNASYWASTIYDTGYAESVNLEDGTESGMAFASGERYVRAIRRLEYRSFR